MDNTITVKRLRSGSVFKLLLIGNLVFFLPLSLLAGVLSIFGASTITWNNQVVTGLPALLVSPLSGAMFALVFSVLGWISVFIGLWVYSAFRPLELEFIPLAGDKPTSRLRSP